MLLQIEELEGNEEYKKTEEKAKAEFKKEMENLGENDYERYKILHQEYIRKIEEAQMKALAKSAPKGIHEDYRRAKAKADLINSENLKAASKTKAEGAPHLFSGIEAGI